MTHGPAAGRSDLTRLRKMIATSFNNEELKTLCLDLSVDYEDLPEEGKSGTVRELILYLGRREQLDLLLEKLATERPVPFVQADLSCDAHFVAGLRDELEEWRDDTSGDETTARNSRISRHLKQQVRQIWVEGVLKDNLYQAARLELGLTHQDEAVDRPWAFALERPNRPPQLLPPKTSIAEVFNGLGGAMLVLGEPGSGKTITLLELAEALLDQPGEPVPLVLNLSTWAARRKSMVKWLVEEMNRMYGVNRRYAPTWLASADYALLVDGLDEVQDEARDACVAAINTFRQEHSDRPLAVCSRTEEYGQLAGKLRLNGAVTIQPLTPQEVDAYLATGGDDLAGVRALLAANAELVVLARSPLMLNILALAYQGRPTAALLGKTAGDWQRHLFKAYVDRMFERRGKLLPIGRDQAERYLAFLAGRMRDRQKTVFYVEELHHDWLGRYHLVSRLAVGVGFGLVVGLVVGHDYGLVVGLVGGLMFGQFAAEVDVRLTALDFSWPRVWQGLFEQLGPKMVVGLVGGLLVGLLVGLHESPIEGVAAGAASALALVLVPGLQSILKAREVQSRAAPNQGIHLVTANALQTALFTGLVYGLVGVLVGGSLGGLAVGLVVGLVFGLFVGLLVGMVVGLAVVNQATIRLILAWRGWLPLRQFAFLDSMAERILLRKVGGGYIFVHRLLLDYFAEIASSN